MNKIGKFKIKLINIALTMIDRLLISKIKDEVIQSEMRTLLKPINSTVEALGDTNPNDTEQIKAIWKKYVNVDVTGIAEARVRAAIEKIKQDRPELAGIIEVLLVPTMDTVRALTDDNDENIKQLTELWGAWIASEETEDLFLEVVLPAILDKVD